MTEFIPSVPIIAVATTIPVRRVLGRNPGPMTGPGTNSYLIGWERLCLLDPGPADELQCDSFMQAIGKHQLTHILVTHTHADHSPGALRLQQLTGAELVGLPAPIPTGHDLSFRPTRQWHDGDLIDCGDYSIQLIHTPGHVSNHICFLLREEQLLFTGDHILQGTTSVILPPDGDMSAYLDSLRHLQTLPLRYLAPGHGAVMENPQAELAQLIAHRLKREQKIIAALRVESPVSIDQLVLIVYDDVAAHLIPWAKKTLLAHLIKLQRDGLSATQDEMWRLLDRD